MKSPKMKLKFLPFHGTLFFLVLMAGCSIEPSKWYRLGANDADFERDRLSCEDELLATGTTGLSASTYSFQGCMEQRGWKILDSSS